MTVSRIEGTALTLGSTLVEDVDKDTVILALSLLSHWWGRPTADEVALWVKSEELEEYVAARLSSSLPRLSSNILEAPVLLDEYERLFVGPGPVTCSPYESYWRNDVSADIRRSLMGPCTVDLNRLYSEIGLEVTPGSGELPDQLTIELEALAYSLSLDDGEAVARSLFVDHLAKWLSRLCRAVTHEAELPFYRDLAELTTSWKLPITRFFESMAPIESSTG